jgi:hypothetical protein
MSFFKSRFLTTALTLLTASLAQPLLARNPNVVLVFIDDMGYADIGPFGAKGYETPHLDRLAARGVAFTRTRVSPRKELPLLAQKALGAARFTYVQENETNDGTMTTTWRVIPDVLSDKVKCSGVSRVVDVPGGCERIIEGELTVSIPFVGGTIEKHVMEQLERSYARGADVAREFLARAANA